MVLAVCELWREHSLYGEKVNFVLVEQIWVVPKMRMLEVATNCQGSCLFCVPLSVQLTIAHYLATCFEDVHENLYVIE